MPKHHHWPWPFGPIVFKNHKLHVAFDDITVLQGHLDGNEGTPLFYLGLSNVGQSGEMQGYEN